MIEPRGKDYEITAGDGECTAAGEDGPLTSVHEEELREGVGVHDVAPVLLVFRIAYV